MKINNLVQYLITRIWIDALPLVIHNIDVKNKIDIENDTTIPLQKIHTFYFLMQIFNFPTMFGFIKLDCITS